MVTVDKLTKSGRRLAATMRTVVSFTEERAGFSLRVVVATLECGHMVDTTLDAEDVVIGRTRVRCIACKQGR